MNTIGKTLARKTEKNLEKMQISESGDKKLTLQNWKEF